MAKIILKTKEEFYNYAKKILKEEILRLQEAKAEEKIKARQLTLDDRTPEKERKKIEDEEKRKDVQKEIENTDARWTDVGFQRRKPTPPPPSKLKLKTPDYADIFPKDGKEKFPSIHMKDVPENEEEKDDEKIDPTQIKKQHPKTGIGKVGKDYEGFDRTFFNPKGEHIDLDVSNAPEYAEELGSKRLRDYKNYLGRMLLNPSTGFDKKYHRLLVSAKNKETGDTEDAMLQDLSADALINLAMQYPSLLKPTVGTFENFLEDVRGNTPIGQMYDPEMDKGKYTFELGDVVPTAPTNKIPYKQEKDYLDTSQEEVASELGMSKPTVSTAEISALKKYGNLYNISFMKAAEQQSAKLADLTVDFLIEFEDQITSESDSDYEFAFKEYLRLLIEKGMVGQYIENILGKGKVGGFKLTPNVLITLYTKIDEVIKQVHYLSDHPNQAKTKEDKFLLTFVQNPIALQLMVEERNGIMTLFEYATHLFLNENSTEEDIRENLTHYISTYAPSLYGHRENVSKVASPHLRDDENLDKDIKNRLKARQKSQKELQSSK
jgi:hypothetical protein